MSHTAHFLPNFGHLYLALRPLDGRKVVKAAEAAG
jgi:hypothetical protein